jgi:hypothetical protein
MTEDIAARCDIYWDSDQPGEIVGNQYIVGPVPRIVSSYQPSTVNLEELERGLVHRFARPVAIGQVVDHRAVVRLGP